MISTSTNLYLPIYIYIYILHVFICFPSYLFPLYPPSPPPLPLPPHPAPPQVILRLRQCCCAPELIPGVRRKQAEYNLNEITRLRAQGDRDGKVRDLTPEEALKLLVMFRNKKKGKKKAKRAVAVDADGWEEAGGAGEMEEEKKDEEDAEEEEEGGEEDEEEDSCGCGGEGKVLVSPCSCVICTECWEQNESEEAFKGNCIMCGDPAHTWARLDDVEALSEFAEGRDPSKLAATKRKRSEHLNELGALNWSLTAEPCFVPPKVRDLLGRIGSMHDADPKHKCVVFSFFTTYLNIIGYCLKAAGL